MALHWCEKLLELNDEKSDGSTRSASFEGDERQCSQQRPEDLTNMEVNNGGDFPKFRQGNKPNIDDDKNSQGGNSQIL